jgi:hypothetical protein
MWVVIVTVNGKIKLQFKKNRLICDSSVRDKKIKFEGLD